MRRSPAPRRTPASALEGPDQPLRLSFELSWRLLSRDERRALVRMLVLPAKATLRHVEALFDGLPDPLGLAERLG
ncbi:MAG: hypothetical protein AAF211_30015 [Myxococcota bacterium]